MVQNQDSKRMRAIEIIVKEISKHPSIAKNLEKSLAAEFKEKPCNLQNALENRFLTNPKIL